MKKLLLICIGTLLIASTVLAQEKVDKKPERIKLVKDKSEAPSKEESKETVVSKEDKIQSLNNLLIALDKKEAWIRNNPEELEVAIETGWFEATEKTRISIAKELKELKQ